MEASQSILQACAVPFRRRKAALEFCLVTSIGKRKWVFPKGIIDPGETDRQTALKEAHEEAGLEGKLVGKPLGKYEYRKWDSDLIVTGFLMEVAQAHEQWDESPMRRRRFMTVEQAMRELAHSRQRPLLEEAIRRLES